MSVLRLVLPVTFTLATLLILCCPFAAVASPETTARARKFLQAHEAKLRPLEIKAREALKQSKSSEYRRAVWEASKAVGRVVEADLKELVKLRNQAAVQLGFKNYHALLLYLNE